MTAKTPDIQPLLDIMQRLRDPENGCPWDLKQSYQSLVPMTLEEVYEVADAIDHNDIDELKGELGDLLLHIVFYSQIAKEQGDFDFADVLDGICEKMIRRHPHIFSNVQADNAEQVQANWEAIKQQEREHKHKAKQQGFFDGITLGLPALKRAKKLKTRAASVGFDWDHWKPVAEKVREELAEVEEVIDNKESNERLEEELGDLLFAVANLSCQLKIDPENALRKANRKFENRFERTFALVKQSGKDFEKCSLEELDNAWNAVKKLEKSQKN